MYLPVLVKVVCVLEVKPSFPFVAVSDDDDPLLIVAGVIIIVMGFSTGGRNVEDCLLSINNFVLLDFYPSNTITIHEFHLTFSKQRFFFFRRCMTAIFEKQKYRTSDDCKTVS